MKESRRYISTILCILMVFGCIYAGKTGSMEQTESAFESNDSLIVWYTDESMTDYLSAKAVEYHEKYNVRVLPKLQSGNDYVESIYSASIEKDGDPDLYILSNDALEKAYLSGCASVIQDEYGCVSENTFPKTAMNAVTYKGNLVAYPYYFETSALIYNKTYLHEMASNLVQAENAKTPDENGGEVVVGEEETTEVDEYAGMTEEEQIEARMQASIPATFDDLLTFANEYDAPAEVETVFKWDVRDLFYNFFFIGNYINLGGECGDNADTIDVYNLDAIKALGVYQELNQFFSFESEDVTYAQVVDEFKQGKLVFATATTEVIKTLEDAKTNGEFEYEYGIAMIPDLNSEMDTRSLSVTNTLVVNGYSDKQKEANRFAKYLCVDNADTLLEKTSKIPSKSGVVAEDNPAYAFVDEYSYSVPMPKVMATSNYWLQMENTFSRVWSGADVSASLKSMSERIKKQISGEEVIEEYIDAPKEEAETMEYLDEDAMREAAQKETEEE